MSENQPNRNEEIDLLDLFRRIGKTFGNLSRAAGRAFMVSFVFILRRWLPLGISIVLGIILAFIMKSKSESLFTSDLVLKNNLALMDGVKLSDVSGTTAEMINKVSKLHKFCIEKNFPALSSSLSMKPELLNNISDINAFWIIDKSRDGIPDYVDYTGNHDPYDTVNIRMQNRLNIRIKISQPQNLYQVRQGIMNYIERDSLFQQQNSLRLAHYTELLDRITIDIQQLDSLQKVKYFEETRNNIPKSGGQMIFLQEQKTQLLYPDMYDLYSRKQSLDTESNLYKSIVTILSDFYPPMRRVNGLMFYIKSMVPAFFGFTLLILIFLANRAKLEEIFKKY